MTSRLTVALLLGLLAWALPMAARAQACGIITGNSDVAFGTYDPTRLTDTPVTGNVQVYCQNQRSVNVALGAGSGTLAQRTMLNGPTNVLNYNLWKDASYTTIFGTNAAQSMTCTIGNASGGGCTGGWFFLYYSNFPVYGRITAGQYVTAGNYSDDVPITITF